MSDPIQRLDDSAREALVEGDVRSAKAQLKKMQAAAPDDIRTIELEGDLAVEDEQFEKARAAYQRLCDRTDDLEINARGEHSLGLLDMALDDLEAARDHLADAVRLYRKTGAAGRLKSALGALGQVACELGDFQFAAGAFRELLTLGPAGDPEDEEEALVHAALDAEACRQLADTLRLLGQLPEAEAMFRDAIARFEEMGDDAGRSISLDGLGVVMQVAGRYDEAEALHRESLAISVAEEDLEALSATYGNLTMLFINRKDWDAAEEWAWKTFKVEKELENEDGMATTHLHLAMIDLERENFDAAEKHLKKARQYYEAHGTPLDMIYVLSHYGELHRRQGKLDLAEQELRLVMQIAEEMGHGDGIAKTNDQLAELRMAQGRLTEARALWELSLSQYEALGSPDIVQAIKANLEKLP